MTTKNVFQMAAMIAGFASASFAQGELKATVNFPFTADGVTMAPGTYKLNRVSTTGGRVFFTLRNREANKAVIVTTNYMADAKSGVDYDPKLVFQCGANRRCALAQIWDGTPRYSVVRKPAGTAVDAEDEFTEVAMTPTPARGL